MKLPRTCFCILKRVNLGMLINHQTSRELGDFVEIFDRYDAESLAVIDRQQKKLVADERFANLLAAPSLHLELCVLIPTWPSDNGHTSFPQTTKNTFSHSRNDYNTQQLLLLGTSCIKAELTEGSQFSAQLDLNAVTSSSTVMAAPLAEY
ncbi:hypothetical protein L208DRAFT_335209 [Tricholoma matsutake]|nr:hypothetical protein L208DRAFT_335209 [Tricholoma matsutake 945]